MNAARITVTGKSVNFGNGQGLQIGLQGLQGLHNFIQERRNIY